MGVHFRSVYVLGMRVGSDLKTKALLALEEALHESRYGPACRTRALRFALAYLWREAGGDIVPFAEFWKIVGDEAEAFRFGYADRRLEEIYKRLCCKRDDDLSHKIWGEVQRRLRG